jgi:osmotically-inducible protein OsmY
MLRRLFGLLVLAVLVAAAAYYWKARSEGREPRNLGEVKAHLKDAAVTGSVKAALELNRSLRPHSIGVSTDQSVVTLTGQVPQPHLKELAERTAAAVPEVERVANKIGVGPSPPPPGGADARERSFGQTLSDEALEMQVRLALSLNRNLKGTHIAVRAFKREVELSGEVSSEDQRKLAVEIVRETEGVAAVRDAISVRGQPVRPVDTRSAVESAIKANPNLAAYPISVREENGRIVLAGSVRTGAEKDLAGLLAQNAAGARVENALEIKP